jgi:membrane-associated phospholipid phosphatase
VSTDTRLPRIARTALIGAEVLIALFVATWYAVFHFAAVDRVDISIFNGFRSLAVRPVLPALANDIANLCDVFPYVFLCLIPLTIAWRRSRRLVAGVILVILICANETTEILKHALGGRRPVSLPTSVVHLHSFPSGHATASMTLGLCCVLAVPARWRPRVAIMAAVFAVAVVYSFLTLGWHYPSDALGGFLVASTWTLLGIAAIAVAYERRSRPVTTELDSSGRRPSLRALAPACLALTGAGLLGLLAFLLRPDQVVGFTEAHKSFVVGAIALGALGVVLATGVMLTLTGPLTPGNARGPTAAPRRGWPRGRE